MKIDRLLNIITILLQKDKVTAPYLAKKFEVSRRTINRDIEDICRAGIPIITLQGMNGGITIEEGFKIDKSVLTYDELEVILTGLKGINSVSKDSNIESILNKLTNKKDSLISLHDNIIIDLASHYKSSLSVKIKVIKEALKDKNLISFDYYSKKGVSNRVIEPYYITFQWSSWYVFGYCLKRAEFRLFKLNRVIHLSVKDEFFIEREIPKKDMDLNNYFVDAYGITILFDPSVAYRLVEEYGMDSFHTTQEGKLLFQNHFTDKDYMLSWIFSFADKAEIIEPTDLREEMRQYAEKILQKYKKHDR